MYMSLDENNRNAWKAEMLEAGLGSHRSVLHSLGFNRVQYECERSTGCRPPLPRSSKPVTAGRNHLNKKITPLLPTGIGEWYGRTIQFRVKQRSCADVNSPYKGKCWTNSGNPLVNSLLWGEECRRAQLISESYRPSRHIHDRGDSWVYSWYYLAGKKSVLPA